MSIPHRAWCTAIAVVCALAAHADGTSFRLDCIAATDAVCSGRSVAVDEPVGTSPSVFTVRVTPEPPLASGFSQIRLLLTPRATSSGATVNDARTYPGNLLEQTVIVLQNEAFVDVQFAVLHDPLPELEELFDIALELQFVAGGAAATVNSSAASLQLAVPPNDVPYGEFGFTAFGTTLDTTEGATLSVSVTRQLGTFHSVVLAVQTTFVGGTATAADLAPPFNTQSITFVTFAEDEIVQTFSLSIADDELPELAEDFGLVILNATVFDSTGTEVPASGLINPARSTQTVQIAESNYPFGLFQFRTTAVAAIEGTLATRYTLVVDRMHGLTGDVSIRVTMSGTATVGPGTLADVNALGANESLLRFSSNGAATASITVVVLADSLPEQDETVTLELQTPTGLAPGINPSINASASRATITIAANDNAAGVFGFNTQLLPPMPIVEPTTFSLVLERDTVLGGAFYNADVAWEVTDVPTALAAGISPLNGTERFFIGDVRRTLFFTVSEDAAPEVPVSMTVQLTGTAVVGRPDLAALASVSASRGSLQLLFAESDSPVGLFGFLGSELMVTEPATGSTAVVFHVLRQFGNAGTVTLQWTVDPNFTSDIDPPFSGLLVFGDNDPLRSQNISLGVKADALPELTERIPITLTLVTAIPPTPTTLVTEAHLLNSSASQFEVVVQANDFPYGLIQFESALAQVTEPVTGFAQLTVTLRREGGIDALPSAALIRWEWADPAVPTRTDSNLRQLSGVQGAPQVVFLLGTAREVNISLLVLPDQCPELSTRTNLTLNSVALVGTSGGDFIGLSVTEPTDNQIEVLPNGFPEGHFGVESSATGLTFSEGSTFLFTVARSRAISPCASESACCFDGGTFGTVNATWRLQCVGANCSLGDTNTITPMSGVIEFTEGQVAQSVAIAIADTSASVLQQNYTVEVTSLTPSTQSPQSRGIDATRQTITVNVAESDFPFGRFWIEAGGAHQEGTSAVSLATIHRGFGMVGAVTVEVRIGGLSQGASAALDLGCGASTQIVFPDDGVTTQMNLSCVVLADGVSELDEMFAADLVTLTPGTELDLSRSSVGFTVLRSGNPYGEVTVSSSSTLVTANETAIVTVQLERTLPALGSPTVTLAANPVGEVSVLSTVRFTNGSTTALFNVSVLDDGLPESTETVLVSATTISGPDGVGIIGAKNFATFTIPEHGPFSGVFGFAPQSSRLQAEQSANITVTLSVLRSSASTGRVRLQLVPEDVPLCGSATVSGIAIPQPIIDFFPGTLSQMVDVVVTADDYPELEQCVQFRLVVVSVTPGCSNNACVGLDRSENAEIRIPENDDAYGLLEVTGAAVSRGVVFEGDVVPVQIERRRGTFGQIAAVVTIVGGAPITAASTSAAVVSQISPMQIEVTVTFAAGDNTPQSLGITIGDDGAPEDNSTLVFAFPPTRATGGVALSSPTTLVLVDNDDPNGILGFPVSAYPRAVENSTLVIVVVRSAGLFGVVTADWQLVGNVNDFVGQTSGTVRFASGQQLDTLSLQVLDDGTPETQSTYSVVLGNVTGGATINLQQQSTSITIPDNDDPYGVFGLRSVDFSTTATSRTLEISVERVFGSTGTIDLPVYVRHGPGNGANCAALHTLAVAMTPIVFVQNVTIQQISVAINATYPLSSGSTFCIVLGTPTLRGRTPADSAPSLLAGSETHNATVPRFVATTNFLTTNCTGTLSLDEGGPLTCLVTRIGGEFGTISIPWNLSSTTGGFTPADVSATSAVLEIAHGSLSAALTVLVLVDGLPEFDEPFSLTFGAVGDPSLVMDTSLSNLGNNHNFVIAQNEYPYGLFEPEQAPLNVFRGSISQVTVVRQGGATGAFDMDIRTVDGTAVAYRDFANTAPGTLSFAANQRSATFPISILRPSVTEIRRFQVVFYNIRSPNSAPNNETDAEFLGGGQNMSLTIAIVQCADPTNPAVSLCNVGFESTATLILREGVSDVVRVLRTPEAYGPLNVTWELVAGTASTSDFGAVSQGGLLQFAAEQRLLTIPIVALVDGLPELTEQASIRLTAVTSTRGVLTASSLVTVEIPANEVPFGSIALHTTGSQSSVLGGRLGVSPNARPDCTEPLSSPFATPVTAWGQATSTCRDPCQCMVLTRTHFDPLASDVSVFVEAYNTQPDLSYFDSDSSLAGVTPLSFLIQVDSVATCAEQCWQDPSSACVGFTVRPVANSQQQECLTYGPTGFAVGADPLRTFYTMNIASRGAARPYQDFMPGPRAFRISGASELVFIPTDFLNDTVPELDETFAYRIVNVSIIDLADSTGMIAVNQSAMTVSARIQANDIPHGIVHLTPNTNAVVSEPTTVVFNLTRSAGAFGPTNVTVGVRNSTTGGPQAVLGTDFRFVGNNFATFLDQQRSATVAIEVLADGIPELEETFTVFPLAATGETVVNSTTSATLGIAKNDDADGRFALSCHVVDGLSNLTLPTNVTDSGLVVVSEGEVVTCVVTRSAGLFGQNTVQFSTQAPAEGTRLLDPSTGLGFGTLVFQDNGPRSLTFTIVVADDNIPQEQQGVSISITAVSPVVPVDVTTAFFTVNESDVPNGIFSLATATSIRVEERDAQTPLNITVVRNAGLFGTVDVMYRYVDVTTMSASNTLDTTLWDYTQGASAVHTVMFGPNDVSAVIQLYIVDDLITESAERFSVELVGSTLGRLSTTEPMSRDVIIEPSDGPNEYGSFSVDDITITVDESNTSSIAINRAEGSFGDVVVTYQTGDFAVVPLFTFVGIGTFSTSFPFTEVVRTFSTPSLEHCARLAFVPNGGMFARGLTFAFDSTINFCFVVRERALLSDLVLSNTTFSNTNFSSTGGAVYVLPVPLVIGDSVGDLASNSSILGDFTDGVYSITFASGQTSLGAPLHITDDTTPENNERFWFRLLNVTLSSGLNNEGPRLVSSTSVTVIIGANDAWNGNFVLDGASQLSIAEGSGSQTVDIRRTISVNGNSTVTWVIMDSAGQVASSRFAPASNAVFFGPDLTTQTIVVTALDDGVVQVADVFTLQLVSPPTNVATIGTPSSAAITIPTDPAAGGMVGFDTVQPFSLFEGEQRIVRLTRTGTEVPSGASVRWTVTPMSANANVSNLLSTSGVVVFAAGVRTQSLTITTLNDDVQEGDQDYLVTISIESTTPFASVSATHSAIPFTVLGNDDSVQLASQPSYTLVEGSSISVAVNRGLASLGIITIDWALTGPAAGRLVDSVGSITFGSTSLTENITLTLPDDAVPQLGEVLLLQLTNASAGVILSSGNIVVSVPGSDAPLGVFALDCPTQSFLSEDDMIDSAGTLNGTIDTNGVIVANVTVTVSRGDVATSAFEYVADVIYSRPLGTDFVGPTSVHFAAGVASSTIVIGILGDAVPEALETLSVSISTPQPQSEIPNEGITPPASVSSTSGSCVLSVFANDNVHGDFTLVPYSGGEIHDLATTVHTVSVSRGLSAVGAIDVSYVVGGSATSGSSPQVYSLTSVYSGATANTRILAGSGVTMDDWVSIEFATANLTLVVGTPSDGALQLFEYEPSATQSHGVGLTMPGALQWTQELQMVSPVQSVSGFEAADGTPYLVISGAGSVVVSRYTPGGGGVIAHQTLTDVTEPSAVRLFSLNGRRFLIVPPRPATANSSPVLSTPRVYQWQDNSASFVQSGGPLPCVSLGDCGVRAVSIFAAGDAAIMSFLSGSNPPIVTVVRWSETANNVVQQLNPSSGASQHGLITYSHAGWTVLAHGGSAATSFYRWNITAGAFNDELSLAVAGSVSAFTFDRDLVLSVVSGSTLTSARYTSEGPDVFQTFESTNLPDVTNARVPIRIGDHLLLLEDTVAITTSTPTTPPLTTAAPSAATVPTNSTDLCNAAICGSACTLSPCGWSSAAGRCVSGGFTTVDELTAGVCVGQSTTTPAATIAGGRRAVQFSLRWLVLDRTAVDVVFPSPQTVHFADNEASKDISFTVVADGIREHQEDFSIALTQTNVTRGASIDSSPITVTIGASTPSSGGFGFSDDDVYTARVVEEPEGADVSLSFAVQRWTTGTNDFELAPANVSWTIASNQIAGGLSDVFVHTSGVVDFRQGETARLLHIILGHDTVPELSASFSVVLGDASGGGSIVPGRERAGITVNASDSPHGGVGIAVNQTAWSGDEPALANETGTIEIRLARLADAFGEVLEIAYTISDGTASVPSDASLGLAFPAATQFTQTTGTVIMGATPSTTFLVQLLGDAVPEVNATYTLTLTSTNSSNVDIVSSEAVFTINVGASDGPFGSAAVSSCTVTSSDGVSRTLDITFSRSAGLIRDITGRFAVSHNAIPGRTSATAAQLYSDPLADRVFTIANGSTTSTLSIPLSPTAPLDQGDVFAVRVLEAAVPIHGNVPASLTAALHVVSDSMARGYVTINSMATVVEGDLVPVSVVVERVRGTFGAGNVTLSTVASSNLTVTPSSFVFPAGGLGLRRTVAVIVVEDVVPELDVTELITLTSPVGVALQANASTTAVLIVDNDNVHGLIGFPTFIATGAAVEFVSNATHRGLNFDVERVGGRQGAAIVGLTIAFFLENGVACPAPLCPTNVLSPPVPISIRFDDGVDVVSTYVPADDVARFAIGSYFEVSLDSVTLAAPGSTTNPIGFVPGRNHTQRATVVQDQYTYGVVEFAASSTAVSGVEGTNITLVVMRTGPVNQPATVSVVASVGATASTADFSLLSTTVAFAATQRVQQLMVALTNDVEREGAEVFSVALVGTIGPAVGVLDVATVTIVPSDGSLGDFGFAQSSLAVTAIEGDLGDNTNVSLQVVRTVGLASATSVGWAASHVDASGVDVSPNAGILQFSVGQSAAWINVSVPGDLRPEILEEIVVTLGSPSEGTVVVAARSQATISVPANDGYYLSSTVSSIALGASGARSISFQVRQDDTGPRSASFVYSMSYRVATAALANAMPSACSAAAFQLQNPVTTLGFVHTCTKSVTASSFSGSQSVTVTFDSAHLAVGETINITLLSATDASSAGALLPVASPAVVSFVVQSAASDGYFRFSDASQNLVLTEPTTGVLQVPITLERVGGSFVPLGGTLLINWVLSSSSAAGLGPARGFLSFSSDQQSRDFNLSLTADSTPELDIVSRLSLSSQQYFTSSNAPLPYVWPSTVSQSSRDVSPEVTVLGSNAPHGVVQFVASSRRVFLNDFGLVALSVERDALSGAASGFSVPWTASTEEFDTFPGLQQSGSVSFAAGEYGPVRINILAANPGGDVRALNFTVRLGAPTTSTVELGTANAASVTVQFSEAAIESAASVAACSFYQEQQCAGITNVPTRNLMAAIEIASCLTEIAGLNIPDLCTSELVRVQTIVAAITAGVELNHPYAEIGGASQVLVVIERLLETGRAPSTLNDVAAGFAASLLSSCGSLSPTNCSCTRTMSGTRLNIEVRRATVSQHQSNPKFPSGSQTLPSVSLPSRFVDIPGLSRFGPDACTDVYYIENTVANLLQPTYRNEKKSLGTTSVAVGIVTLPDVLMPAGSSMAYQVVAPTRYDPRCQRWDSTASTWTSADCKTTATSGQRVSCACEHMGSMYSAVSNDEDTVPALVVIAAIVDMVGGLALFGLALFSDQVRTRAFAYAPVMVHYAVAVIFTQLFFVLSVTMTKEDSLTTGTRFFIGMALHFFAIAFCGVTCAVTVFIYFSGYRGRYTAARAMARFTFAAAWVGAAILVVIYIIVALDDADSASAGGIYGDVSTNGRASFIMGSMQVYWAFGAEAVLLCLGCVVAGAYMVGTTVPTDTTDSTTTLPALTWAVSFGWIVLLTAVLVITWDADETAASYIFAGACAVHVCLLVWACFEAVDPDTRSDPETGESLADRAAQARTKPSALNYTINSAFEAPPPPTMAFGSPDTTVLFTDSLHTTPVMADVHEFDSQLFTLDGTSATEAGARAPEYTPGDADLAGLRTPDDKHAVRLSQIADTRL